MERQAHRSLANLITSSANSGRARSPSVVPLAISVSLCARTASLRTCFVDTVNHQTLPDDDRVSKIEFAASDVCLRHWFPASSQHPILRNDGRWLKIASNSFSPDAAYQLHTCVTLDHNGTGLARVNLQLSLDPVAGSKTCSLSPLKLRILRIDKVSLDVFFASRDCWEGKFDVS